MSISVTPSRLNRFIATLVLGLAFGQAEHVFASTIAISPISISLRGKATSALMTVTNQGDESISVEVTAFSWAENEKGESTLAPTEDLLVFPLLASIPAHSEQRIRIGLFRREKTDVERSFRVIVEEMPASRATSAANTISVRSRFSVPVFLEPPKPVRAAVFESKGMGGGHLRFQISNPGNVHFKLQLLTVTAEGADGATLGKHELPAWYLLAGGVRVYDLPLDPKECAAAKAFLVEAKWADGSLSERVQVTPDGCK